MAKATTKISNLGKTKAGRRGFTLLELLMVIALLGLLGVVMVPKFSSFFRVSVQSSVRRFAALVRFAYDQSVLTGRVHRIVLDLDDQKWFIEAAEPNVLPLDKAKSGLSAEGLDKDEQVASEPQFQATQGDKIAKIPTGVTLIAVDSWRLGKDNGGKATKGQISIYAFPNGYVDEATVYLAEQGKEKVQRFKVSTQALTGRVRIETETERNR